MQLSILTLVKNGIVSFVKPKIEFLWWANGSLTKRICSPPIQIILRLCVWPLDPFTCYCYLLKSINSAKEVKRQITSNNC